MVKAMNIKTVLFSAIIFGCANALNYRYNNCISRECGEDWTFNYRFCGCVKDGDAALPGSSKLPIKSIIGGGGPLIGGGPIIGPKSLPIGVGINPLIIPPVPQTIFVPGASPGGVIQLPSNPSQVVIQQPSPAIVSPISPPSVVVRPPPIPVCQRTAICGPNQVFSEQQCQCVCITTPSCFPGQILDRCQCRCPIQRQQCQLTQVYNPNTCQCENRGCPTPCNACEQQNPFTCACQPIIICPAPQRLNPSTCQCDCGNIQCNSQQRLNPLTCACQCNDYVATQTETIPGLPGAPIPGPPNVINGPSRPGTRRPGTSRTPGGRRRGTRRGRRRRAEKREVDNEAVAVAPIAGPEVDDEVVLLREKRRRRRRPGTRSRPGTRRPGTRIFIPTFIPGPQLPDTVITRTVRVSVCPAGTFQNDVTCTCN